MDTISFELIEKALYKPPKPTSLAEVEAYSMAIAHRLNVKNLLVRYIEQRPDNIRLFNRLLDFAKTEEGCQIMSSFVYLNINTLRVEEVFEMEIIKPN